MENKKLVFKNCTLINVSEDIKNSEDLRLWFEIPNFTVVKHGVSKVIPSKIVSAVLFGDVRYSDFIGRRGDVEIIIAEDNTWLVNNISNVSEKKVREAKASSAKVEKVTLADVIL